MGVYSNTLHPVLDACCTAALAKRREKEERLVVSFSQANPQKKFELSATISLSSSRFTCRFILFCGETTNAQEKTLERTRQ